jgi:spermidine/putrescine transport system substrate-binding protein
MSETKPSRRAARRSLLTGLGASAAVGLSFGLEGCARERPKVGRNGEIQKLNFYNWDTYIGKTTLKDFRRATGIKVDMSLFATNDELFAKLKAGNPGFDVIVPSNEFVQRMVAADMIEPLDHAKLPNLKNLYPKFVDVPFDPGRRWSIPYTWDCLGIGYRKSKVDGVPDSWKWLFDSPRYRGRIGVYSEANDLIECVVKYLGHSIRHIPQSVVDQAVALMTRQKPNIKVFHDDNGQDLLLSGDIDIVMEFNGDIAQVMREDEDLDFVVPREGSVLHSDALCIAKGAPRPDNAHQFLNYILSANAGAELSRTILYPSPNAASTALMPASYRDNPVIFPPADRLARCEYAIYEGPDQASRFDEAVTRIRAA